MIVFKKMTRLGIASSSRKKHRSFYQGTCRARQEPVIANLEIASLPRKSTGAPRNDTDEVPFRKNSVAALWKYSQRHPLDNLRPDPRKTGAVWYPDKS